ncbi:MAG: hypothetical protein JRC68_09140 [Deltaproteobacteria bacterium]|nr:hypothetical protein [Deltaproteobacteria bacterium]
MSENQMKDRIAEELKKAKEAGQITTEKVSEIVKDVVSVAVAETKGGVEELRPVVKDAVAAAVEGLKETGADAKDTMEGAVHGAIAGARSHGDQAVDATRDELRKLESRLVDQKAWVAQSLRQGLEGAKEAGTDMSEDMRKLVESSVIKTKLKSTELLGLTKQTVKEAVKQAIESGEDVKETVAQIAASTTERALEEGRFTGDRVHAVAQNVISGAVEAARELKTLQQGPLKGHRKGLQQQ